MKKREAVQKVAAAYDTVEQVILRLTAFNRAVDHWRFIDKYPEDVALKQQSGLGGPWDKEGAHEECAIAWRALHDTIKEAEPIVEEAIPLLRPVHRGRTCAGPEALGVEEYTWPEWALACARRTTMRGLGGIGPLKGPDVSMRENGPVWKRLMAEGTEAIRIIEQDGTTSGKKRKYVTNKEAEVIARENYELLWRCGNQSEWARTIGCNPRTVAKLKAWKDAELRRNGWTKASERLHGLVDPKIIEALQTGDVSVLATMSDAERERFDSMTDDKRQEIWELMHDAARDELS